MRAPGTERRRRIAAAAALPWPAWAVLRLLGAERGLPLVPAMAFTPQAVAGAALSAATAAGLGARLPAVVAGGSGAVLAGAVWARTREHPMVGAPAGPAIRVATVSMRLGHTRPDAVLELVRAHGVDVLSVQELTPDAERGLRAAGIDELLPHHTVAPAPPGALAGAAGGVWSRFAVRDCGRLPGSFEQPYVRLDVPGAPEVEVTAVHAWPPVPTPAAVRRWRQDLAALPAPEASVLRVLAGDFNATLDHAALRAVLRQGYRDAARATGLGLAATWRPARLRRPRLTLDHVLTDPRIGVASVRLLPVAGSDHDSVLAELVLPSAGS